MKIWSLRAAAGVAVSALAFGALQAPAQAAPPGNDADPATSSQPDNLPNPLAEAQAQLRQEAVAKLVKGEATLETRGGKQVIKVAKNPADPKSKDKFVSYDVNREEDIFTILTDFGTQTLAGQSAAPGPVHNQIPAPDRVWDGNSTDDNSTYWVKDFDQAHYQDLMFGEGESFKDFYLKQSGGRFLAKGDVSNWVTVPYNEARYGSNKVAQSNGYWNYIRDTATAWFDAQKAAGKSDAEITTYLKQFDKVDRYDYDDDGDFNEPDGYIDHFQAIHAGEGEEAGGGAQGTDAIWSHRWYAYSTDANKTGPDTNKLGGVPLGTSGLWIGDYTTEPENGGLGRLRPRVRPRPRSARPLRHQRRRQRHRLLDPDVRWLVAQPRHRLDRHHARLHGRVGEAAAGLARLPHRHVRRGRHGQARPGRAGHEEQQPGRRRHPARQDDTTAYNTPHSGTKEWWSGQSDNLIATLARTVDLTGATTSASVDAWVQADIEKDYDYLYGEVSTDGGSHVEAGRHAPDGHVGLDEAVLGPLGLQGHDGAVPVQVRHRRRPLAQGRVHRRRHRHEGRRGRRGRRRRGRSRVVDGQGLLGHLRDGHQGDAALLHRGEPHLHGV